MGIVETLAVEGLHVRVHDLEEAPVETSYRPLAGLACPNDLDPFRRLPVGASNSGNRDILEGPVSGDRAGG